MRRIQQHIRVASEAHPVEWFLPHARGIAECGGECALSAPARHVECDMSEVSAKVKRSRVRGFASPGLPHRSGGCARSEKEKHQHSKEKALRLDSFTVSTYAPSDTTFRFMGHPVVKEAHSGGRNPEADQRHRIQYISRFGNNVQPGRPAWAGSTGLPLPARRVDDGHLHTLDKSIGTLSRVPSHPSRRLFAW